MSEFLEQKYVDLGKSSNLVKSIYHEFLDIRRDV